MGVSAFASHTRAAILGTRVISPHLESLKPTRFAETGFGWVRWEVRWRWVGRAEWRGPVVYDHPSALTRGDISGICRILMDWLPLNVAQLACAARGILLALFPEPSKSPKALDLSSLLTSSPNNAVLALAIGAGCQRSKVLRNVYAGSEQYIATQPLTSRNLPASGSAT